MSVLLEAISTMPLKNPNVRLMTTKKNIHTLSESKTSAIAETLTDGLQKGEKAAQAGRALIKSFCTKIRANLKIPLGNPVPYPDSAELLAVLEIGYSNPVLMKEILSQLQIQATNEGGLYDFLSDLYFALGPSGEAQRMLGLIWAGIYSCAGEKEQEKLRGEFLANSSFFSTLHGFPEFLRYVELSPSITAIWLCSIRKRLGSDMASGGLWSGLASLAEFKQSTALGVVRIWTATRPSDETASMAATILGNLRARSPDFVTDYDAALRSHPDEKMRLVYFNSWIIQDSVNPLLDSQYSTLIDQMGRGTPDEQLEAFNFLRCTLINEKRSDESFGYGVRWIQSNLPSEPTDFWRHFTISLSIKSDSRCASLNLPTFRQRIVELLPIKPENRGTWNELEQLLISVLEESKPEFQELLFDLTRKDTTGIVEQFNPHSGFNKLPATLTQVEPGTIVEAAWSSADESVRHLGFVLFQRLGIETLSTEITTQWNDGWVALLIYQMMRESLFDDAIPRFLLALNPRVSLGGSDLRALFVYEACYQMRTLPGVCLESLKKAISSPKRKLLKEAAIKAEKYFEQLRPCYRSAINSMQVAGFPRALRLLSARRGRELAAATEKGSLLMEICSKSYMLYGHEWQTYIGGSLGEVSGMHEFLKSVELPRLPFMDPDGYGKRMRDAKNEMQRIQAFEQRSLQAKEILE